MAHALTVRARASIETIVLGIYLAGELIPAASLPDFKATIPGGGTKFKVAVTSRAAFSAAQTRACVLGSTVTISANGVNYTGTITGFGCREGYGLCQIEEATIMGGSGGGGSGSSYYDIVIIAEDDVIRVQDNEDTVLDEGTLGVDDTDCFDTAVANCPNRIQKEI